MNPFTLVEQQGFLAMDIDSLGQDLRAADHMLCSQIKSAFEGVLAAEALAFLSHLNLGYWIAQAKTVFSVWKDAPLFQQNGWTTWPRYLSHALPSMERRKADRHVELYKAFMYYPNIALIANTTFNAFVENLTPFLELLNKNDDEALLWRQDEESSMEFANRVRFQNSKLMEVAVFNYSVRGEGKEEFLKKRKVAYDDFLVERAKEVAEEKRRHQQVTELLKEIGHLGEPEPVAVHAVPPSPASSLVESMADMHMNAHPPTTKAASKRGRGRPRKEPQAAESPLRLSRVRQAKLASPLAHLPVRASPRRKAKDVAPTPSAPAPAPAAPADCEPMDVDSDHNYSDLDLDDFVVPDDEVERLLDEEYAPDENTDDEVSESWSKDSFSD